MTDPLIREVRPGGQILVEALGFPAGQTPEVRLILLSDGSVGIAATTAGVSEDSPGNYDKTFDVPADLTPGDYATEWKFSGVWNRDSEIIRVLILPSGGYTTVDDLRYALQPGGGSTDKATAANLQDMELADAIIEAGQEVNGRLGVRYSVPFDPVPDLVAQITRDIAAYKATLTHRRHQGIADQHPVAKRHEIAQALLKDLAAGKAELDVGGEEVADSSGEPTVINERDHLLFDEASELGPIPTYFP